MSDSEDLALLMTAHSPGEAEIVCAVLREAGIPTYIAGRMLQDEFAATQRLMGLLGTKIQVPRAALAKAQEALAAARARGERLTSGKSPEGGAVLSRAAELAPSPPAPISPGEPSLTRWRGTALLLGALVLLLGYLLFEARAQVQFLLSTPLTEYVDGNERHFQTRWKDTGQPAAEFFDANENGIRERILWFNRDGQLYLENVDQNENEVPEVIHSFNPAGERVATWKDLDENGCPELWEVFYPDGATARWQDTDQDGIYETRELYDAEQQLLRTDQDLGREGLREVP